MTTYTKRDIRAADMLAMILVGFGLLLMLLPAMPLLSAKVSKDVSGNPALWIAAGVAVILGVALHLKVKQLVRSQGREPDDYPGVPE